MRILIIRHGDPDYERDTLTEKGKKEAVLLAERLKKEKIDYIYSSPLGRAKDTCMYAANALGKAKEVKIEPLFCEFQRPHSITYPDGREKGSIWDLLPEYWTKESSFYDVNEWKKHPALRNGDVVEYYGSVVDRLDEILKEHGYCREGGYYKTEKGNTDTIAIFCHFGVEMILLSRLCNISPFPLLHHFVALPTSVTTLYTEERREGIATFRCCGYGDISHLYARNEAPSFSARFCEVYGNGDRQVCVEMKKHIKVAAALLFDKGKIFATKRGDSPYCYVAHKYEFPGGKIENGERGEDAVKRELKEELDLDVTVGGLYASHTFEYPDFIITLFLYECEMQSNFVLKEHESYAWIYPSELKEEEWAPADADVLGSLKRVFGGLD